MCEHQSINEFIFCSSCIQLGALMIQSRSDGFRCCPVSLCVCTCASNISENTVSFYPSLFSVYKSKKSNSFNNTQANNGRLTAAFCAFSDLGSFHSSVLEAYGSKYIFTAICASWLFLIAVLCLCVCVWFYQPCILQRIKRVISGAWLRRGASAVSTEMPT